MKGAFQLLILLAFVFYALPPHPKEHEKNAQMDDI